MSTLMTMLYMVFDITTPAGVSRLLSWPGKSRLVLIAMKNMFDESEPTSVPIICDEPEPRQGSAACRIKAENATRTENCKIERVTVPTTVPRAVMSSEFNTFKRQKLLVQRKNSA